MTAPFIVPADTLLSGLSDKHGTANPSSWNSVYVILFHGIFMTIAWLILVNIGTIIAAFYKHYMTSWFRLHIIIQTSALILTVVAFIMAFGHMQSQIDFETETHGKTDVMHFTPWHGFLGLVILISSSIQVTLGLLAHLWYNPERTFVPLIDKSHWWVGRITFGLAIFNIILGFYEIMESAPSGGTEVLLWTLFICFFFCILASTIGFPYVLSIANKERSYEEVNLEDENGESSSASLNLEDENSGAMHEFRNRVKNWLRNKESFVKWLIGYSVVLSGFVFGFIVVLFSAALWIRSMH
eukprot:TRINITY_DN995_c0_g1_i1.p1 TRINITY_DN995_c0_g1~~TRINITY_DN995_c0_g1_i1.p1  ORF type:complete len:298 (-),score=29.80 TRINITY_DN995_c0_g1_i1:119-1012(-)